MKITPYLSLDLETTGLDLNKSLILEIGAVFDDGISPIEELPTFHRIIYYETISYSELPALVINADLLKVINDIHKDSRYLFTATGAFRDLNAWILQQRLRYLSDKGSVKKVQVAGKNVAGFDLPILKNNAMTYGSNGILDQFQHRTIDVGSMYADVFGENVTLGKINELTGRNANVSHKALDDAFDVVYAIRHKMKTYDNRDMP